MNRQDEKSLVSGLKQGREDAFQALIRQYEKNVFTMAYWITLDREESRDIAQEVFIKVYENIRAFKAESRLSTWIHRITVNQCLNWQRRWKRRFRWRHQSFDAEETGESAARGPEDDQPEARYNMMELKGKIGEALKALPEDARAVFVLKEMEDLGYDEIAAALNIKRGTVSSRLFYARKKLKDLLKPYMETDGV